VKITDRLCLLLDENLPTESLRLLVRENRPVLLILLLDENRIVLVISLVKPNRSLEIILLLDENGLVCENCLLLNGRSEFENNLPLRDILELSPNGTVPEKPFVLVIVDVLVKLPVLVNIAVPIQRSKQLLVIVPVVTIGYG
jgi:hypothetical protein